MTKMNQKVEALASLCHVAEAKIIHSFSCQFTEVNCNGFLFKLIFFILFIAVSFS